MKWGKWSDKSNVLTFAITAITAAVGLFKWLSAEVNLAPHVAPHAAPLPAAAGHPVLPILLIGLLVLSFCFTGIAHYMARRGERDRSADAPSENSTTGPVVPLSKLRTAEEWIAYKLERLVNQKFEYGEVLLDGKEFTKCTFTHMNLYYDGTAPMSFVDCEFDEDTVRHVHTHNPGIAQWMENTRAFGLLKEGAKLALTPQSPVPKTSPSIIRPAPSALSRRAYSSISAAEVLDFLECLRGLATPSKMPVKIVCTPKGRPIGELLVKSLLGLGFELLVNKDDASHIFAARTDQADGILLRGPANPNNPMMFALQVGMSRLNLSFKINNFPTGPEYNYIQIEIGNRILGTQWE
jgi:hypothetical protein